MVVRVVGWRRWGLGWVGEGGDLVWEGRGKRAGDWGVGWKEGGSVRNREDSCESVCLSLGNGVREGWVVVVVVVEIEMKKETFL